MHAAEDKTLCSIQAQIASAYHSASSDVDQPASDVGNLPARDIMPHMQEYEATGIDMMRRAIGSEALALKPISDGKFVVEE